MDSNLKHLKDSLKKSIEKNLNSRTNLSLKDECLDAVACLSIFKCVIQSAKFRNHIINLANKLLNNIDTGMILDIERALKEFVENMIISILKPFDHLPGFELQCIEECIKRRKVKLIEILGFSIGRSFQTIDGLVDDFETCWHLNLKTIFSKMKIIREDNTYLKKFVASILSNGTFDPSFHFIIQRDKFMDLGNQIFGNIKNFRFIKKACLINDQLECHQFPEPNFSGSSEKPIDQQSSQMRFDMFHNIEVKVSKISSRVSNPNNILAVEQTFLISPTGLQNSRRSGNPVLFGSHPLCDIQLPDETKFDLITFVIYHHDKNYYIMDCSKNCELKRKLEINDEVKLTSDMLIDIAEASLVHINREKIHEDSETGEIQCEIIYEFLKGELANPLGYKYRSLLGTEGSVIVLGSGKYNKKTDIILSEGGTVSAQHLSFSCLGGYWTIRDLGSSNGTFIIYKNYNQYTEKSYSTPCILVPLVDYNQNFILNATIKASGIVFFLKIS